MMTINDRYFRLMAMSEDLRPMLYPKTTRKVATWARLKTNDLGLSFCDRVVTAPNMDELFDKAEEMIVKDFNATMNAAMTSIEEVAAALVEGHNAAHTEQLMKELTDELDATMEKADELAERLQKLKNRRRHLKIRSKHGQEAKD